ncbi:hypothetical protein TNCT_419361 [Trichonephila clavata]|uniref:Uncharacterized protein n=1 Tax=Trichonephila clavata TaxID=2740835 RepID=A0A8X6F532_TRICU|nr:hypothetical protein TNCT_419361 [Trichonephila clavata]
MLSLKERITIVSWKLGGKTYEEVHQLSAGKQPPTRDNIKLLENKFRFKVYRFPFSIPCIFNYRAGRMLAVKLNIKNAWILLQQFSF